MAVSSEVQICNLALGHIGEGTTIQSLAENSTAAIRCNLVYAKARDSLLEAHDWGFARRHTTLALSGTAPDFWDYSYAMPSSALAVRYLYNQAHRRHAGDEVNYELARSASGETVLYTDQQYARCAFTDQVTDTARFSEAFVDCLALNVATMIALPITQDRATLQDVTELYTRAFYRATSTDANQSEEDYWSWTASQIGARA